MSNDDFSPVKYVLYTHYGRRDEKDFETWDKDKETPIASLPGVRFLIKHLEGLHQLLTSPAYEGLLVLFYGPEFPECLDGIAD